MSVQELLANINQDKTVPDAVEQALPKLKH
jgi:N-acetylmuramic acid 6-phosphate (MurNAc-6-P) etherase